MVLQKWLNKLVNIRNRQKKYEREKKKKRKKKKELEERKERKKRRKKDKKEKTKCKKEKNRLVLLEQTKGNNERTETTNKNSERKEKNKLKTDVSLISYFPKGAEVEKFTLESNEAFTREHIKAFEDHVIRFQPKMITMIHCETPSGTLNPLEEVGWISHRQGNFLSALH